MRIKNYLSFSQYTCFNASPKQYIKIYLEGKKLDSKYLKFGGDFASGLENNKLTGLAKDIANRLPPVKERECEFLVDFFGVALYGKLDGLTVENGRAVIDEYKTGKHAWTQNKVDKHEQLTFYAIMVNKKLGIAYENIDINLHWLETIDDIDGSVIFTGKISSFKTKRTFGDVLKIRPKIKKAWDGIDKLIDEYLK